MGVWGWECEGWECGGWECRRRVAQQMKDGWYGKPCEVKSMTIIPVIVTASVKFMRLFPQRFV